ncbi:uncharacterized protein LOC141639934 [Silene latifolia]|uniref:uncharacterized protein LOC141639934 n=1 Tax=Silene latifolia TaxID=37657 RepID=UPI003D78A21F
MAMTMSQDCALVSRSINTLLVLCSGARLSLGNVLTLCSHRFYGQSIPFGDIEKVMADKQVRACLTIEQSLEDYKNIILSFKSNMSAHHSPAVVFGTGYSGALATYFRIKYPDVTIGALASSAPMFLTGTSNPRDSYCPIVSKYFEDFNRTCYQIIKDSWKKLDDIASQIEGITRLSHLFKTCRFPSSISGARCNEIIFPVSCGSGTMLPPEEFNLTTFEIDCQSRYSVMPNLNFLETYFGNKVSNVIFFNGLRDPFSGEGILENLSESVVVINTTKGI